MATANNNNGGKASTIRLNSLSTTDLYQYLCWCCPLNDENIVASIAREIVSYTGNEIILSFLSRADRCEKFNFNVGCVSNDGICYIHHRVVRDQSWVGKQKPKVQEYGFARVPLFFSKIYSQSLMLRRRFKQDKIRGIGVLNCSPSININVNQRNTDNKIEDDDKGDDDDQGASATLIKDCNKERWIKVMKAGIKSNHVAENKAKYKFENFNNSGPINWETNNMEKNMCHWHELAMTQVTLNYQHCNKAYKIEKTSFVFYHNYFKLYCYNSTYFNQIGKNKCIIVNENTSSLDNNHMKIVDFWRQNNILYMLRGSTLNAPKKNLQFYQTTIEIENGDDDDETKENKTTEQPVIGDCEFYQIKLNQPAISKANQNTTGTDESKNTDGATEDGNSNCDNNNNNKEIVVCEKMFTLSNEYINKNCSYFDETSQTLIVGYKNEKEKRLGLKVFQNSKLKKSKIIGKRIEWPKEIATLFIGDSVHCDHLFHYSFSDSMILVVKLKLTDENGKDSITVPDSLTNVFKTFDNGFILVQFKLDFETLVFKTIKIGICHEQLLGKKLDVVCYDDTRGCVIINTQMSRNLSQVISSSIGVYKNSMKEFSAKGFKTSMNHQIDDEILRKENNYQVVRINDLVTRWKSIL